MHPSNQGFSKWCQEVGFGDLDRRVRADAMWFASIVVQPSDNSESHPTNIRRWYNETQQSSSLPDELQAVSPVVVVQLQPREAEKVAKVINRAKANDEGSETAKRHVESLAKKHKVTVDELTKAASHAAPAVFFQFTPEQVDLLAEIEENVRATVPEMKAAGLTLEAIAAVFSKVANDLVKGE